MGKIERSVMGQWSRTKSVLNNEIYTLHGREFTNAIHGLCMGEGAFPPNFYILIKALV